MSSPLIFEIHSASPESNSAARHGTLSITNSSQSDQNTIKRIINTPGCFMFSIKGSVPHLTPDNMRQQDFAGINVSLEQLLQMDQPASFPSKWPSKSFTLADYLHVKDLILLCDLRDYSSLSSSLTTPETPQNSTTISSKRNSPNTDRHVSLSTPKGVRQLTLDDYLSVVRQFRPDIMVALADNIIDFNNRNNESKSETDTKKNKDNILKETVGEKRVRKSIDRTLRWLDQILLERQGRDGRIEDRKAEEEKKRRKEKKERSRQARQQQLENTESDKQDVQKDTDTPIEISEIETEAWQDVALFAHVQGGAFEEERIKSAKETSQREGVDGFIVDLGTFNNNLGSSSSNDKGEKLIHLKTSIDHLAPQKPRMVYGIQTPEEVLKAVALGVDLFDTSYPYILTEEGKASMYYFGPNSTANSNSGNKDRWINLWDDEHGDKFVPILEGCECYSCKGGRHTRAYINHLLKAHEMLANVLLMSHNLHQYSKFFAAIREAVNSGTLEQYTKDFEQNFGVEPARTGEKHKAQIIVEEALTKRNQRLDIAEPAVVDAIGSGDINNGQNEKKRPESDALESDKETKKQKQESEEQK